jgi:acetyl esterase/lipase
MATHKLIEEKYADEFTVTASAPMAGPHDMTYASNRITSRETYSQPGYISFTYMSYNTIEKLNRPANDLFQNPYAERIPKLMDGSKTIGEANDKLTTNMKSLFTENFITEFLGDGEQKLKNAFAKNSLVDWSPNAPIMLVHGENDITVGYNNSVIAHDKLKANGADISLITIPNGTHGSSVFPAYTATMVWFSTLKK